MKDVVLIPISLEELEKKLEAIVNRAVAKINKGMEPTDQWFSIEELINYLPGKPAKQTIYQWVNKRTIPHSKSGNRLSFKKSEIDKWLESGSRGVFKNDTKNKK